MDVLGFEPIFGNRTHFWGSNPFWGFVPFFWDSNPLFGVRTHFLGVQTCFIGKKITNIKIFTKKSKATKAKKKSDFL